MPQVQGPLGLGDQAPELELPDTHGTPVRIGGVRPVPQLVVFLPVAFTATCTSELRELDAARSQLSPADVVAVSCDAGPSLRAWAESEHVGVTLLSDFWPHGAVARAFGVLNELTGAAARGTFLLDDDGAIAWSTHSPAGTARSVIDYRVAVAALTG